MKEVRSRRRKVQLYIFLTLLLLPDNIQSPTFNSSIRFVFPPDILTVVSAEKQKCELPPPLSNLIKLNFKIFTLRIHRYYSSGLLVGQQAQSTLEALVLALKGNS